jgi:hypothetical protein
MWDYIAAEAAGINQDTFYYWLRRGDGLNGEPPESPYLEFSEAVRQARAEARGSAEIEVKRTAPAVYLTKGPGRDQPGRPGWTSGDGDGAASVTAIHVEVTYATGGSDQPNDRAEVTATVQRHLPPRL